MMLLRIQNATVTICHSRTVNLSEMCSQADILVARNRRTAFVTADFAQTPRLASWWMSASIVTDPAEKAERWAARKSSPQSGTVVGDVHRSATGAR